MAVVMVVVATVVAAMAVVRVAVTAGGKVVVMEVEGRVEVARAEAQAAD